MLIVVSIAIAWWIFSVGTRLVMEMIAVVFGVLLFARARRTTIATLATRAANRPHLFDFDRRPSAAERRALTAGLRSAIRLTEFRSLFPEVAVRADRIADTFLS